MFVRDLVADVISAVPVAGVFHPVGRDDKDRMLRDVLFAGIAVDPDDMVNGASERVEQCGASACAVFLPRHRRDLTDRKPVVDHPAFVVEEIRRYKHFSSVVVVLLQHAVEPADRVVGQMFHGTAHIEHEYQFGKIFFHFLYPFIIYHRWFIFTTCFLFFRNCSVYPLKKLAKEHQNRRKSPLREQKLLHERAI